MIVATYAYNRSDKGEHLAVSGTDTRVLTDSNPRFKEVRDYLFAKEDAGEEADFEYVLSLIDSGPEAVNKLLQLSERVSYQSGTLYFDGDEVETALAKHIVDMIKSGDDNLGAFVLFLENLAQNPSKKSRKALFEWVQDRQLTLTPEGDFVAYKGVTLDGRSIHSGGAYVDGEWVTGQIPNEVGSVVTMPRSGVDADRDSACSTGLHAGTSSYARSFGHKTLIVAINPRDVVMVPKDCNSQKLRVCRYKVLDNSEVDLSETTYGGEHRQNEVSTVAEHGNCVECGDETKPDEDLCTECKYYEEEYCHDCGQADEYCDC